jgi:hypothetical protein
MPKLTVKDFFARFPTEEACLDHVMNVRYGMRHTCRKCGVVDASFHRLANRRAYSCAHCGDHVYPCANTVLQDTRTPLQLWFYALYLFVTTRHGVSGKELQRQLGVTYKTAWRIGMQLRTLICSADEFRMLKGHVEADEVFVGGKAKASERFKNKTIVMGLAERDGLIQTEVVPDTTLATLRDVVVENVEKGAIVSTDEYKSYSLLTKAGYQHGAVNHAAKEYARLDPKTGTLHHTNTIESFWSLFQRSIASTHIHVSRKYMQRYLDEFTFRSNHRQMGNAMFDLLIAAF